MTDVLKTLQEREAHYMNEAKKIRTAIVLLGGPTMAIYKQKGAGLKLVKGAGKAKRRLSAAGRRAISLAAKRRWAKVRAGKKKAAGK